MFPRSVEARLDTRANLEPESQKGPESGPSLSHFQGENSKYLKLFLSRSAPNWIYVGVDCMCLPGLNLSLCEPSKIQVRGRQIQFKTNRIPQADKSNHSLWLNASIDARLAPVTCALACVRSGAF